MLFVRKQSFQTLPDLCRALQRAIQLEHATIPPYLTAYWSLTNANASIRGVLNRIVLQEMAHMALAANILNAIGGHPAINDRKLIPRYPGALPFHIGDKNGKKFEVGLAPFSCQLVRDIFLTIEEPEHPVVYPKAKLAMFAEDAEKFLTIGEFYDAVAEALTRLHPKFGHPELQVSVGYPPVTPVLNLQDALNAVETIKSQGEGTTSSPLESAGGEPVHYYAFMGILEGAELKEDPTVKEGFSYSGSEIKFDPKGVLPLAINPTSALYRPGSPERKASDAFNQTYKLLLDQLQTAFNGSPKDLKDKATPTMRDTLPDNANTLISITLPDGRTRAAPTFEYI
jgi:hypothetical protein